MSRFRLPIGPSNPRRKSTASDSPSLSSEGQVAWGENAMDPVNQDLVDRAVRFINEKACETMYKGAEEIGAYLLENFFNGDIELAISRSPYKCTTYAMLVNREDLLVHPATLSVMVRVAAQETFFFEKGFRADKLSYTHKAELVKLPNTDQKLALAREVSEGGHSTRQLALEVKRLRRELAPKRQTLPSAFRYVQDPSRFFESPTAAQAILDDASLSSLTSEERQRVHEQAELMISKTREWMEKYEILAQKLEQAET